MLLFPHAARKVAVAEWERRHPGRPWPFDPPHAFRPSPQFTVHEVAEADELMLAATTGKLGLPEEAQTVAQKAAALQVLVAVGVLPDNFWVRADWNNYQVQKQEADYATSVANASHDHSNLESWSSWVESLPVVAAQVTQQNLAFQARGGAGIPRSDYSRPTPGFWTAENLGEVSALIRRYSQPLTPQQELANLIALKNIAIKENWGAKAIREWTALVGRKARDYRHYFEKEGY